MSEKRFSLDAGNNRHCDGVSEFDSDSLTSAAVRVMHLSFRLFFTLLLTFVALDEPSNVLSISLITHITGKDPLSDTCQVRPLRGLDDVTDLAAAAGPPYCQPAVDHIEVLQPFTLLVRHTPDEQPPFIVGCLPLLC